MAGTPRGSLTTQHCPQEGFSQPLCDIFPSPTNTHPVPCSPLANPAEHLRKLPRHQHCGADGEKHEHLVPRQQAVVGFWSWPPQKGHFPPCHCIVADGTSAPTGAGGRQEGGRCISQGQVMGTLSAEDLFYLQIFIPIFIPIFYFILLISYPGLTQQKISHNGISTAGSLRKTCVGSEAEAFSV